VDVCSRIAFARTLYVADLRAMPDPMLRKQCGGKARTGYDVTYELVGMYTTFSALLLERQGEIRGPAGWVKSPEEFQNPDIAVSSFEQSLQRFVEVVQSYGDGIHTDAYPSPVGPFTPMGMANLVVWHTMYHSGQLNFIQTLCGDDQFHWIP
jgi:hypothetical protein